MLQPHSRDKNVVNSCCNHPKSSVEYNRASRQVIIQQQWTAYNKNDLSSAESKRATRCLRTDLVTQYIAIDAGWIWFPPWKWYICCSNIHNANITWRCQRSCKRTTRQMSIHSDIHTHTLRFNGHFFQVNLG